jgi:hypothetical protein
VHALAENAVCAARHAATGRIGLQASSLGVETPSFGDDQRVVAIEGNGRVELVDRRGHVERRDPITTVRAAASFLGVSPGVPAGLWHPVSTAGFDDPLSIDLAAMRSLIAWYGFVGDALAGLASAGAMLDPLTLWPEHLDFATSGGGVNYGGSPGDSHIGVPYLYVGPHERLRPAGNETYWNESFGAALRYDQIESLAHAVAFLVRGFTLTSNGS